MEKNVIIFGYGDFGQVAYSYLTNDSEYDVIGFTAHKEKIDRDEIFDLPIIPFEEIEKEYSPNEVSIFIAIPYTNLNQVRAEIFLQVKEKGYNLISYVNSNAIVSNDVKIGDNCFILENNVIQPFTKIGDDVIMWSGNHIGHHSSIGDHCFITSHVVIAGNTTIESFCFLGINSTIRDGITISKECLIGAGSLIMNNTKEQEVYVGSPTNPISKKSNELESF